MRAAEVQQEYEDLDALIQSAGWGRFKAHVAQQWGTPETGGGVRFQQAVSQAAAEQADADATAKLRQIVVAQKLIQGLILEFEARRERLKPIEEREHALSRRGGL